MDYIYLHGLGQTASSWQPALDNISVPGKSICLDLVELIRGTEATYSNLYAAVCRACDAASGPAVLCGLSLGAVLALNYAVDHPRKVKALVLIAAQYKMPRHLLALQNVVFHLMPESSFQQTGFRKADFISLCKTTAALEFGDSLRELHCPTLLLCGEKDSANKKASKELSAILSGATLQEIPNAGHEVNTQSPEKLAEALQRFYQRIE